MFCFLTITLYNGTKLINNYPKFKNYETGSIMSSPDLPDFGIDVGEGLAGIVLSILLWVAIAILMVVLILIFEAILWMSIFILFASLYWIFIRALRLVFYKGRMTKGDLTAAIYNAFLYTFFYTSWLFGIAFIIQIVSK